MKPFNMFGLERHHFIPVIGFAGHAGKTIHFMEAFEERALFRHMPGGALLSAYNAGIFAAIALFLF